MERKLRIYVAGHRGAKPEHLQYSAREKIQQALKNQYYCFSDDDPDIIIFMTGGSEMSVLEIIEKAPKRFRLFIGFEEENGYAAATEAYARARMTGIPGQLLTLRRALVENTLKDYRNVLIAQQKLKDAKILLIGNPAPWLIASMVDKKQLLKKFDIRIIQENWPETDKLNSFDEDESFYHHFNKEDAEDDLKRTARLSTFVRQMIEKHKAEAITTECFPLLDSHKTTFCLGNSFLNGLHIPAGCEGDLTSITGMLLLFKLTGKIPWMANINNFKRQNVMFSHCTVPLNMLESYRIDTHYESGIGTAVRGKFKKSEVTVFRLSPDLDKYFLAKGEIMRRNDFDTACRTQISIELRTDKIKTLQEAPLGNHHLILPGNHIASIELFCIIHGINQVEQLNNYNKL